MFLEEFIEVAQVCKTQRIADLFDGERAVLKTVLDKAKLVTAHVITQRHAQVLFEEDAEIILRATEHLAEMLSLHALYGIDVCMYIVHQLGHTFIGRRCNTWREQPAEVAASLQT